jgi:UDP-GlcNAc:undecaprenyl-phosphate/decaprenyl-phosphate GlcNAc-1-phosphate transferase
MTLMIFGGLIALTLSFFLSILATPLAGKVARHFGMIDRPERHKAHPNPTPLLGGCAVFAAILGPSLLVLAIARVWASPTDAGLTNVPSWMPMSLAAYIPGLAAKAPMACVILLGAAMLHVMGIIDDRKSLGPWIKLTVQTLVAVMVVVWTGLIDPTGDGVRILTVAKPTISTIVSVLWIVAITNSFNFLDNMDGLSAGVATICAAALLGASASMGQMFVSGWLCLMLGSLAGFLVYNFAPAKIFMGDAGSLVIGFMMAVLSILTTYVPAGTTSPHATYNVFVPVVLMAVPLYDTFSVIFIRLRERRNPMVGDRRHFSHRLVRRGMSVRSAVLTIYLCTLATAIAASLLPHVDSVGAVLVIVQTFAILGVIGLLEAGGG